MRENKQRVIIRASMLSAWSGHHQSKLTDLLRRTTHHWTTRGPHRRFLPDYHDAATERLVRDFETRRGSRHVKKAAKSSSCSSGRCTSKSCRGTLAKRRLYLDQLTTTGKTIAWLLNFRRTLFAGDPETGFDRQSLRCQVPVDNMG